MVVDLEVVRVGFDNGEVLDLAGAIGEIGDFVWDKGVEDIPQFDATSGPAREALDGSVVFG